MLFNSTHCAPLSGEHMIFNSSLTALGTVVEVVCEDGYDLIGQKMLWCREELGWSAIVPVCHQTEGVSPMIIAITTVATIIALAVLIIVTYMLFKNCQKDKSALSKKMSAKAFENKMRDIGEYFAITPDNVGMPAMLCTNWDEKLRGRSLSATALVNRKTKASEGYSNLAEHFDDNNQKDLIY